MTNCLEVDDCIDYLPRKTVATALGISLPTLREHQYYLNKLSPKGWDYQSGDRGFTRKSIEVLFSFRVMVLDLGRRQAIRKIRAVMEQKNASNRN